MDICGLMEDRKYKNGEECIFMRKICKAILIFSLIIMVCLILLYTAIWYADFSHCESLTSEYAHLFKDIYTENTMTGGKLHKFKVISYHEEHAKIYCVTEGTGTDERSGHIVWFKKDGDKWVTDGGYTIWTEFGGSVDGYIWPYINFRNR